MRTIFKYELAIVGGPQVVAMPRGAIVLSADRGPLDAVNKRLSVWAQHDEVNRGQLVDRTFYVLGTGHALPDDPHAVFLATVQAHPFVWHVFERLERLA